MQETWEIINEVPTCVKTWGRGIHDVPTSPVGEDIIFIITGNPGVSDFYSQFSEKLHKNLRYPVWVICHAGHDFNGNKRFPNLSNNTHLYDLKGQVEHKVKFIEKFVPANARLHVIGHSIGSYMALEIMKSPNTNKRIVKSYLLFPTIEYMEETKNGQYLTFLLKYFATILIFLSGIYSLFPRFFQVILINFCFLFNKMSHTKENIKGSLSIISPKTLNKILFLANDEMKSVKERNNELIKNNLHKIKMLYGAKDDWAPATYYNKIKLDIPNVDATICDHPHAFCISRKYNEIISLLISEWISEKK